MLVKGSGRICQVGYRSPSNSAKPPDGARTGCTHQVAGCGLDVSMALVGLLTLLYLVLPVDVLPDFAPVLGQFDDLLALVAGGGSVSLLALARLLVRRGALRRGCALLLLALLLILVCVAVAVSTS